MREGHGRDPECVAISEWQTAVGELAAIKGWGSNKRSVLERIALIHSELSECTDYLRRHDSLTEMELIGSKPEGFPVELADVVMRIMTLCHEEGIDLERAMRSKLAYNHERPYRHGNLSH